MDKMLEKESGAVTIRAFSLLFLLSMMISSVPYPLPLQGESVGARGGPGQEVNYLFYYAR
jgi:hypothetical protein